MTSPEADKVLVTFCDSRMDAAGKPERFEKVMSVKDIQAKREANLLKIAGLCERTDRTDRTTPLKRTPMRHSQTVIDTVMAKAGGSFRPLLLHVGEGNRIERELEFAASGGGCVRRDGDAEWTLSLTLARAGSDSVDLTATWTLTKGTATRCATALEFVFPDWSDENFVFAPAAVYAGNRFEFRDIPWPTYLLYNDPAEHRIDAPTLVNDIPRLKPQGKGRIELRTGSLSTPLLGFQSPSGKCGWMLQTVQGNRLGDHGLSIEENAAHSAAVFRLTSPAIRRARADGSHLVSPSGDQPADWQTGDSATVACRLYAFPARSITAFLRRFFAIRKDFNPSDRRETLPFSAARSLLETLYRDHRWDEACGIFRLNDPGQKRMVQIWQLGWVGGGQVTLPLLQSDDPETRRRAVRNLETIFRKSQAASGFFYALGDGSVFMCDQFRPHMIPNLMLIRKNADWLYVAQRQFRVLESQGAAVPQEWKAALRRQADAFAALWRRHGQFGQWANVETGELVVGGSANGAILGGALALASQTFQNPGYLNIAACAARNYHRDFIRKGYTGGGPAEALSCPDSESAFALLESLMTLHEVTGQKSWLKRAADLLPICASWVVSYDFRFPENSALGQSGARSCGSVWASVQNKHSAPGICNWSGDSLLKYYRATGDRSARELLADIAHGITQYISRADQPTGAMKPGGICERVNLSDWEGETAVGGNIFDSCSWCETAALLTFTQIPGLYVQPDLDQFTVFDHILVEKLPALDGQMKLKLTNPTAFPAEVSVLVESAADRQRPMPLLAGDAVHRVRLDSGSASEIVISRTHNPVMMDRKDT